MRFTKLFLRNLFTQKILAIVSLVFQYIAFDEFLFPQLNSLSHPNNSSNFLKALTLNPQNWLWIQFEKKLEFEFGGKKCDWMRDGRVRVYDLGKKVEIDAIWNGESHK